MSFCGQSPEIMCGWLYSSPEIFNWIKIDPNKYLDFVIDDLNKTTHAYEPPRYLNIVLLTLFMLRNNLLYLKRIQTSISIFYWVLNMPVCNQTPEIGRGWIYSYPKIFNDIHKLFQTSNCNVYWMLYMA